MKTDTTRTEAPPAYELGPILLAHARWVRVGDYCVRLEANGREVEVYRPRDNSIASFPRRTKSLRDWLLAGCVRPPGTENTRWEGAPAQVAGAWARIPEGAIPYAEALARWEALPEKERPR